MGEYYDEWLLQFLERVSFGGKIQAVRAFWTSIIDRTVIVIGRER
jgi:hypothetical protein